MLAALVFTVARRLVSGLSLVAQGLLYLWLEGLVAPWHVGILIPLPGIKPISLALEDGFLTIGPPGKSFNAFMDSFIYPTYNIFAECLLYVRCKMVIDMILAPVDFTETPVNLKFHCRIVLFVGKKKVYYGNKIPWMEKPGSLQPMGSQRVGHD